jgi:hypothetical protein
MWKNKLKNRVKIKKSAGPLNLWREKMISIKQAAFFS